MLFSVPAMHRGDLHKSFRPDRTTSAFPAYDVLDNITNSERPLSDNPARACYILPIGVIDPRLRPLRAVNARGAV